VILKLLKVLLSFTHAQNYLSLDSKLVNWQTNIRLILIIFQIYSIISTKNLKLTLILGMKVRLLTLLSNKCLKHKLRIFKIIQYQTLMFFSKLTMDSTFLIN